MFLSWQNKQNVKVGLWKWKCTHIKRRSDTVKKLKWGFKLEICSTLLTKGWRPEFLSALVMPDRRVDFKIQTSVLLSKVFFGRLTINLLVTKSEEFWSCDKKNQKMRWWPQSLGDKRKRQKKEMVTSWLVLLLTALLVPATWSGPQQTGDRSKGEIFSVFVHIIVNGIHSIHHSLQGQWTSEGSEGENNDQTKYG